MLTLFYLSTKVVMKLMKEVTSSMSLGSASTRGARWYQPECLCPRDALCGRGICAQQPSSPPPGPTTAAPPWPPHGARVAGLPPARQQHTIGKTFMIINCNHILNNSFLDTKTTLPYSLIHKSYLMS